MNLQQNNIKKLIEIMSKLRDPVDGCPWDLQQDNKTILPFTIEEVYEVADAIERDDHNDLRDELGDLLFQIVFYAQLAKEKNQFDFNDIVTAICNKLTRRHPHVFDRQSIGKDFSIEENWETQKQQERQVKSENSQASLLDDIPSILPELKKAQKIQNRVAKQGFDWESVQQVWDKLEEESAEVKEAASINDLAHVQEEIGDLLFVCVNLARHYNVDADYALRQANQKFEKRFRKVESYVDSDKPISEYSTKQLNDFWSRAKSDD